MMNIRYLPNRTARITEGAPEKSMLSRYGILTADTDGADASICRMEGDTILLSAKREIRITVERRAGCYRLVIPMGEGERFFGAGDSTRKSAALRGQRLIMN
ncbi:MAG: hypothetical protein J6C52_08340, partial [Clostridia bacterium]|nr:hypothetical protein [Clostridia bacterium]